MSAFFSASFAAVSQATSFDLEATEVVCHTTDPGDRYFSYFITNVGSETASTPCERFFHASTATDYTQSSPRRAILFYRLTCQTDNWHLNAIMQLRMDSTLGPLGEIEVVKTKEIGLGLGHCKWL